MARAKRPDEMRKAAEAARKKLKSVSLPTIDIPLPDIVIPSVDLDLPDLTIPSLNVPRVTLPDIDLPELHLPSLDLPEIDIPGLGRISLEIPGIRLVLQLVADLFDTFDLGDLGDLGDPGDLAIEIGAEFIVDWIASTVPVLGQIKSGAQAADEWGKAARKASQTYRVGSQKQYLLPGDPRAAADGVKVLLRRQAGMHAGSATIKTTQFAASTAGLALDGGASSGPASATAGSLAGMALKVYAIGIAHKEKTAGNRGPEAAGGAQSGHVRRLADPRMLSSHLLRHQRRRDLLTSDIGRQNWRTDVERMKSKIDPLLREATAFIDSSPYELQGLKANKGTFAAPGLEEKMKAKVIGHVKAAVPPLARTPGSRKLF